MVPGCRFSCDPAAPDPACPDGPHAAVPPEQRAARLVELPVGATEDRLVGSLDLERALSEGVRAYQPGLLADAHRGREVVHGIDTMQCLVDFRAVVDVADHELDPVLRQGVDRLPAGRVGELVEHGDRSVGVLDDVVDEVGADEAGAAGDEDGERRSHVRNDHTRAACPRPRR